MVEGDVHLVLCDNATLTCEGIFISTGSALTIWRQSGGSGALEALAGNGQYGHGEPGIEVMHGASLTINGGHITAHGTGACAAIGNA